MMSTPIDTGDAETFAPMGICAGCGKQEDPMIAIFWATDLDGVARCPECSGVAPSEGYRHYVLVSRNDRGAELPYLHGPYSAGEAERMRDYFTMLDNVKSAVIVPPEEK